MMVKVKLKIDDGDPFEIEGEYSLDVVRMCDYITYDDIDYQIVSGNKCVNPASGQIYAVQINLLSIKQKKKFKWGWLVFLFIGVVVGRLVNDFIGA